MKIAVEMPMIGSNPLVGGASIIERVREYVLTVFREGGVTYVDDIVALVDDILEEAAIDQKFIPIGFKNEISEWYEFQCDRFGVAPSLSDVMFFIEAVIAESIALVMSSLSYDGLISREFVMEAMYGKDDVGDLVGLVSESILENNPDVISSTVSIIYRTMGLTILFSKHDAVYVDEEDISFPTTVSLHGEDDDYVLGAQVPLFRTRASDLLWMDGTIKYLEGVFMDDYNRSSAYARM